MFKTRAFPLPELTRSSDVQEAGGQLESGPAEPGMSGGGRPRGPLAHRSHPTRLMAGCPGQWHSCSPLVPKKRWFRLEKEIRCRVWLPPASSLASLQALKPGPDKETPASPAQGWTGLGLSLEFLAPPPPGGLAGPGLLLAQLQATPHIIGAACLSQMGARGCSETDPGHTPGPPGPRHSDLCSLPQADLSGRSIAPPEG